MGEAEPQIWEGVLIFEIGAKIESTAEQPREIDPDELGGRLRTALELTVEQFESQGELQSTDVRYAGSRGSTRYPRPNQ